MNCNTILLDDEQLRERRHGPLFDAVDPETGEIRAAEHLDLEQPALEKALSQLQQRPKDSHSLYYPVVAYFGYRRQDGLAHLVTEAHNCRTLSDQIKHDGAPLPVKGLTVVFLDARQIRIGRLVLPLIEGPILDITAKGRPFLSTALTLPELALDGQAGGGSLRRADVWLLGIVAAQMVTGRHDLVADYAVATSLGMEITKQGHVGDALELLVPDYMLADNSDGWTLCGGAWL
ncbi:hypothetical protein MAPG_08588 [Magnaporthiopsis poae ATCC 64411]|uniref:Protein kinase domain-containing protein n=1 Tax=Magnaporthiopsis poae (strain ATCC 64411 / 73-15) TaxID=644358 RepID=A0A0C4E7R8_MAGP6|nr:hypothetical protein MAPG_08588 [Magnaporthiopsis poae ATCC 64411]